MGGLTEKLTFSHHETALIEIFYETENIQFSVIITIEWW